MKKIKLGGKWGFFRVALVDDDDFERISKYKWRVRMRGENAQKRRG